MWVSKGMHCTRLWRVRHFLPKVRATFWRNGSREIATSAADSLLEAAPIHHVFQASSRTTTTSSKPTSPAVDSTLLEAAIAGLDHVFENSSSNRNRAISSSSTQKLSNKDRNIAQRVEKILQVGDFEQLPESEGASLTGRVVVLVLRSLDRQPERAVSFFVWAAKQPQFKHTLRSCNQLLDCLVKARKPREAQALFRTKFYNLFEPDDFTYTVLVRGFVQAGDIPEACKLFEEMQKRGLVAGVHAYNILLSGLIGAGRLNDALTYYRGMHNVVDADIFTYNTLLDGFVKNQRYDQAVEFFTTELLGRGCTPDQHTFAILSRLLCKTGKPADARKLLDEMAERGVYPDVVTYTSVIKGLTDARNVEAAFEVFNDMITRGHCTPDVRAYSVLLDGFCKTQMMSEAYEFAEKINDCKPDLVLLNTMMDGDLKARRAAQACEILDEYVKEPSVVTYTIFIHALCKAGKLDAALTIYSHMLTDERNPPNAVTYSVLINWLGKAGRALEGAALFNEMIHRRCKPSTFTCNANLAGLCREGHVDQAMEFFREMIPAKSIRTYNIVINGLCKAGMMVEGLQLLQDMEFAPNAHTYNAFVNGYCKANQIEHAIYFMKDAVDCGVKPNVVIYNTILDGLMKAGRVADVQGFLREMSENGLQPDEFTATILSQRGVQEN